MTKEKTQRKEKTEKKRREIGSAGDQTGELRRAGSYRYHKAKGTHWENCRKYIIKTLSPRTSASATCIYKVDRALLNMNSKILFRRMIAVWTVKTRCKRISLHLKNGSPTEATGVNSSADKTCFITAINIFAQS